MKIGFFGTPPIASYCLEKLRERYNIAFVVAPEDTLSGRNRKLAACEVKKTAFSHGIPVLQPVKLSDDDFLEKLKSFNADIFVVVAYGKLIPESVYSLPELNTINLHPSLLPAYRGAAPVQWALINGESRTGVTVQLINDELDAGDILLQEAIDITEDMTAGELYERVFPLGVDLLVRSIELLASGRAVPVAQDHAKAIYCGKIDRELAHINWGSDAVSIHNHIRGLNPKPGCWTEFRGKNIKVWRSSLFKDESILLEPGQVRVYRKKRLIAGTGSVPLEIIELQPETKKIMNALSFINGYRVSETDAFE